MPAARLGDELEKSANMATFMKPKRQTRKVYLTLNSEDVQQALQKGVISEEALKKNKFYELGQEYQMEIEVPVNEDEEDAELNAAKENPTKKTGAVPKKQRTTEPSMQSKMSNVIEKPPQIILDKVNIKDVSQKIFSTIRNKNYFFNSRKNGSTSLQICNIEDYRKVRALLLTENISFFTFTPKADKLTTLILKNFPEYYEEKDIFEAFEALNDDAKLLKASKFKQHWLLQFDKSSNLSVILSIKYLNQNRVFIERFHSKDILQCKRCQRYNHVASNCNFPYRCVKCGGNHGPQNCKIPSKEDNNEVFTITLADGSTKQQIGRKVHCVLCKTDGHTANYRKCEVFQRIKREKESRQRRQENRAPVQSSFRKINVSYADHFQNPTSAKQAPKKQTNFVGNAFSTINEECNEAFGINFASMLGKINSFLSNYDRSAPKHVKQEKLFQFFFSICENGTP